jgi:pyruvate/2-oxoglutarate dehydrogenase complex dihydrolipoamide acyltransferase (E2) component
MGRNALIALGVLVVAGIGISLANNGANNSKLAANTGNTSQPQATTTAKATATAAATAKATATAAATAKAAPTPAGPTLTNQQQNAARSARQYLDISAFSRLGLIDQLSSSYGEGYAVQDATVAVDSLNVDWNAEAVQSAEAYLKISPFSCNGLIQQLDSAAGEKFTVAQATYGAKQAGAC